VRVLYFSDNSSGHNRRFLEKLAASGHEIWFLDSSSKQSPEGWLPAGMRSWHPGEISIPGTAPSEYSRFLPEFQRCVQELQPDLVHAGPVQSCAYVAALSGFHPLLVTSWGSDILLHARQNAEWEEATVIALRGADGFFCDCNAVRRAVLQFVSIPEVRILQLPWGIKAGLFSPAGTLPPNDKLVLEPGTIPFISTRSWEPLYGIMTLIDAFRIAYSNDSRLRLLLLNDGSQAGSIRDFIARYKLEKVVLTPGIVTGEELPQWFRVARGYISCTVSDGTSVSLLEAMATGLPVVVSDIAANREWVTQARNGALARTGSPEEFAGKLLWVAKLGTDERAAISERNQKVVSERADWDKNFPRLLNFYQHLVDVSGEARECTG
jgi:glycosyltransferase involved in cell wall biosynthesis